MMMSVEIRLIGKGRGWPAVAIATAVAIVVVLIAGSTAVRSGRFDIRDLGFYQSDRIQGCTRVRSRRDMVLQRTGAHRACHSIRHASGTAA